MRLGLSPEYAEMIPWLRSLPHMWAEGEGHTVFRKRNEVRFLDFEGVELAVKKFKPIPVWKRPIYTFFRHTKARRAFLHGNMYSLNGFATPSPVAYIEIRRMGLTRDCYFVSLRSHGTPLFELVEAGHPMAMSHVAEVGRMLARMHARGIMMKDPNLQNFLVSEEGGFQEPVGEARIEVIDINRSAFAGSRGRKDGKGDETGSGFSYEERVGNLKRISYRHEVLLKAVEAYADEVALDGGKLASDVLAALSRYERDQRRKRRWKSLLKKNLLMRKSR